ncbi:uncharacterized protein CEXT_745031 [Caerostris extrusa]|uniref:Neurotransmitter-gated ion-channel transmembrane domain-containing protein n=1 Tax=Caerostris extrusa TaxID=172846 RepID=A0AAV4NTC5_CAEEX|nr:uncharacterized protein CEXT_745031 [Caerostris extrusa]
MAITSISVVVTVVVLNFHYRGPQKGGAFLPQGTLPQEVRLLLLLQLTQEGQAHKLRGRGTPALRFQGGSFRLTIDSLHDELKEMNSDLACNEPIVCSSGHNVNDNKRRVPSSKSQVNGSSPGGGSGAGSSGTRIQAEILRTLQYLLYRQEQEDYRIRVVDEWRQMALVIDRILFWIFFVVTLVSSLSFLVIVPLHRRGLQFT